VRRYGEGPRKLRWEDNPPSCCRGEEADAKRPCLYLLNLSFPQRRSGHGLLDLAHGVATGKVRKDVWYSYHNPQTSGKKKNGNRPFNMIMHESAYRTKFRKRAGRTGRGETPGDGRRNLSYRSER